MTLQIVTANNLRDGEVVYLGAGGKWFREFKDALGVETNDALESLLATASMAEKNMQIVGAYTIPASREADGLKPISMKERIRSQGPSTNLNLGKQASALSRQEIIFSTSSGNNQPDPVRK